MRIVRRYPEHHSPTLLYRGELQGSPPRIRSRRSTSWNCSESWTRSSPESSSTSAEPEEHAWAHIEGCRLIPLGILPGQLAALPRTERYLIYCKSGVRSAHAAALLREQGFADVTNVRGGILAWLKARGEAVFGSG